MTRIEVGKVCYKGPHIAFESEEDFGCCSGHYYATVYIEVVEDYPNPRGEEFAAQQAAEEIARLVKHREEHRWCGEYK